MTLRRMLLAVVLVDFLALTGWSVAQHGWVGFFTALVSTPAGVQVGVDLVLALSLVMGWMWMDARRSGRNALPYLLTTLVLGSVGPLLYLLLREEPAPRPAAVHA